MDVILIVDDEEYIRQELGEIITARDRKIIFAENGFVALEKMLETQIDLVLTDIRMPEMDGLELMRQVRGRWPNIPVITITAFASTETAVQALRAGAYDYVMKPFSIDEVRNIVGHALRAQHLFNEVNYLRGRLKETYSLDNIIGQCDAMQKMFDTVSRVAAAPCNILVTGESGTGKDLVAQAIHQRSPRSGGKFVPINCGSIPEGLLESELFGHVKGAFSGAVSDKAGLVQTANGGTLFLDEIGDMPMTLQIKLLRLIQNRQVQKVGSTEQEMVDVRIIVATNQDLEERIAQKAFRRDLYYRINVVEISLPPLRERGNDVSLLVSRFLNHYSDMLDKDIEQVSSDVMNVFMRYPWPGNVRELENAIERAVTLCRGNVIKLEDIPQSIVNYADEDSLSKGTLHQRVEKLELNCIQKSLVDNGNDLERTAEDLGVSLATLYRKLKKFNFTPPRRIVAHDVSAQQKAYQYPGKHTVR